LIPAAVRTAHSHGKAHEFAGRAERAWNLMSGVWTKLANCLVTGVAGFIGSHLAERLLRDGYRVIGVDCFTDSYPRQIKERNIENLGGSEKFTFIEANLLEIDLAALLRGESAIQSQPSAAVDWVFHLAAQAGVRASWGEAFHIYTDCNVLTTQRLLEAAKEAPLQKFVYASSSSVYGDAETYPTPEDVVPQPISPYGVTKLAGEHLCRLYWRAYGVPAVSLRYFTVYGPRQRPDMAFHRFIRAALERREIVVYGDGEQTRDFTFVGDTVDGTVRAAMTGQAGEMFNLGGGSRVTVNQVIRELESILGKKVRVRYAESQAGDVRHTSANISRAAAMLGYAPRTKLADGLRMEAEWLARKHGEGSPIVNAF
jgi:UDP-glucose 4-epimerase